MTTTMTYAEAGRTAVREAVLADPRVWCVGEDLGRGGVFGQYKGLREEFGEGFGQEAEAFVTVQAEGQYRDLLAGPRRGFFAGKDDRPVLLGLLGRGGQREGRAQQDEERSNPSMPCASWTSIAIAGYARSWFDAAQMTASIWSPRRPA